MEVDSGLQPRAVLEDRLEDLARRAGPGGRLEHDDLAALEDRREALGGALDVGEVGLALARERRRQRDQHRVCVLHLLVVRARDDEALLDERREALGGDVLDVARPAVERVDDSRLHVDDEDAPASLGERDCERQTDVAGADDGDVVEGRLRHGAQAYRAAAMRPEAWPSP